MPPFDDAMARRHKKGLSPRQVRQWVAVARSTYAACVSDGGSAASCEARAIRAANGVTGRPARPTSHHLLTINTALTVPPARMVLNGQEFLTCPVVMVVEGVLNGGLIPGEELIPAPWNGVAITVNHPADPTGQPHSARQPEVLAACGIGQVFRVERGSGQRQGHPVASLRGELWINLSTVGRCGSDAAQAVAMLEAQRPLEVSTAFYSDSERVTGSFYGTPYTEIHHHLSPDHLALLPNAIGACDWQSGCGAPRLHAASLTYGSDCACADPAHCTCQEGGVPMADPSPTRLARVWQVLKDLVTHAEDDEEPLVPEDEEEPPEMDEDEDEDEEESPVSLVTEQQDTEMRETLYGCLAREMGQDITPIFLVDVDHETQSFTYRQGERLRRRYWDVVDGVVTLTELVEDVQRNTQYTVVPGTEEPVVSDETMDHEEEMPAMATDAKVPTLMVKTRVNRLIANGDKTGWTELDRGRLEAMDEATLIRLESLPQAPAAPAPREGYRSLADALEDVEPDEREGLEDALNTYKRRKAQLIDVILANKQNPFTKEELQVMKAERLEKLVIMAGDELPDTQTRPLVAQQYAGRRMPQLRVVQTEDTEVPGPPDTLGAVLEEQKRLGLR